MFFFLQGDIDLIQNNAKRTFPIVWLGTGMDVQLSEMHIKMYLIHLTIFVYLLRVSEETSNLNL